MQRCKKNKNKNRQKSEKKILRREREREPFLCQKNMQRMGESGKFMIKGWE